MSVRLLVAYDGSGFSGYQVQPDRRTVQGELERALATISGRPVPTTAAGRTDAGVHAIGQVVSADLAEVPPDELHRRLNRLLPSDLSVIDVQGAAADFDARRSARWRAYTYLIWNDEMRHPLYDRFSLWVREPVDVVRLGEALRVVEGTHDFSSFARVREDQTPLRTVHEASCEPDGALVRVRLAANAFLHQMVRSIVGSALEVGGGRRSVAWMREALLARHRAHAGRVAPPHGLTLTEVGYEHAPWTRRLAPTWPWASAQRISDEVAGGIR